jgi:hypothetical protein
MLGREELSLLKERQNPMHSNICVLEDCLLKYPRKLEPGGHLKVFEVLDFQYLINIA